jgi:hypothetical protein
MPMLTDTEIDQACLMSYRAAVPDAWGFAWLPDTLDCLLRSQLAVQPRAVAAVGPTLAGELLAGSVRLLEDADARAAVCRGLTDPALRAWWRRWAATDRALRALAYHLPVDWLLALWQAADQPIRTDRRPTAERRRQSTPLAPR